MTKITLAIALAIAAIAFSALSGPVLRAGDQITVPAADSPQLTSPTADPPVVEAARALLKRSGEIPREFQSGASDWRVWKISGGRKAVICGGQDGSGCALVRFGQKRFLVNTDPGARERLFEAAEDGEPRSGERR